MKVQMLRADNMWTETRVYQFDRESPLLFALLPVSLRSARSAVHQPSAAAYHPGCWRHPHHDHGRLLWVCAGPAAPLIAALTRGFARAASRPRSKCAACRGPTSRRRTPPSPFTRRRASARSPRCRSRSLASTATCRSASCGVPPMRHSHSRFVCARRCGCPQNIQYFPPVLNSINPTNGPTMGAHVFCCLGALPMSLTCAAGCIRRHEANARWRQLRYGAAGPGRQHQHGQCALRRVLSRFGLLFTLR